MTPPRRPPRTPIQLFVERGDHPVTHVTLFTGACEYCRAAWMLAGDRFHPIVPFAQLVCHSVELALKSYLLFTGADEQRLRSIGHDLQAAWEECRRQSLEVTFPTGWLMTLGYQYDGPFIFRYWRQGIGWSIPGTPKQVAETTFAALRQIGTAIGDDGKQLALIPRTSLDPWPDA
jgi:hypothetical protein